MAKLITGVIVLHLIMGFIASWLQGGGGYAVHTLAANLTSVGGTVTLDSNADVLAPSVIIIGSERIHVSAKVGSTQLTVAPLGRGYEVTTAASHGAGSQLLTEEGSLVQGSVQTRIANISDASGNISVPDFSKQMLGIIGAILVAPFSFLATDLWMFSALYMAILAGLLIVIAIAVFGGRRV
jgi:hypothetical protein